MSWAYYFFADNRNVLELGLNLKVKKKACYLLSYWTILCLMSLVGGGISQHTLRRSSSERVRVQETRQVNNDRSIAAKVLAHGN